MPLVGKFLRGYMRANLRGQTRLAFFCARNFKSLHSIPIKIADRPTLYIDLRNGGAHDWLKGSPWARCPVEADEETVARRFVKRGDKVLDVGANLGLYTTLFSKLVGPQGRVWAFEPNEKLLPPLRRTVGELGNARLFPFALSDQAGEALLYVPNDHTMGSLADYTSARELAKWRESIGLSEARAFKCELKSVDGLVESGAVTQPDFIKCDVEGAELTVFKGARATLDKADAPLVMFEALEECARAFGFERFAAAEFLQSLPHASYRLFHIEKGGRLAPFEFSERASPNILAVPQSKLSVLSEDAEESNGER